MVEENFTNYSPILKLLFKHNFAFRYFFKEYEGGIYGNKKGDEIYLNT